MDEVVREHLVEFLSYEATGSEQPARELKPAVIETHAPSQQMADDLLAAVHQLVEIQANIWSRSIGEAQKQWTTWSSNSADQLREALCQALDKSLTQHSLQIERIQQEAGRQVDSRWQQWQITLSDQARVMHAQQKELVAPNRSDRSPGHQYVRIEEGRGIGLRQLRELRVARSTQANHARSWRSGGCTGHQFGTSWNYSRYARETSDCPSADEEPIDEQERLHEPKQTAAGDHSNSMFPFLAVLLCTVGALILMLVLIVDQSQASVKQAIDERAEKAEELRAQVEVVRESFREDREKIQLEIERKRMVLQSLEQQTSDLSKELEQLAKTSELIDKDLTNDDSVEQVEAALTDMQKQLQEAAERLKSKLDKPSKSKPVFAIIPYEGGNGTHRRPIYLECRADGILIQPEGGLYRIERLAPALRTRQPA